MSEKENIVITGMARTPMGAFQGTLKDASCAELGAASIRAALERSRVGADEVSETIMGCVLPAGQGQAPARQAALGAEMPLSVCCTTVNKMCGSGMKSTMLAHDLLLGGEERILVAGGMESMTNAPYLLPRARSGMRLGHGEVVDHMFLDGLEDAYDRGKLMGTFAEATAGRYGFSREAQDEFAIRSLTRAKKAIEEGIFKEEIVPVTIKGRKGDTLVETDETPLKANLEKIPTLKPAGFKVGIFSRLALSGVSSVSTNVSPFRPLMVTGTISSLKIPSSMAFLARVRERMANSSWASLEKPYRPAVASAKVPINFPRS